MQRMKVSEIPYERADAEKVCGVIDKAVEKINAAKSVDDVLEARELVNDALRDFYTESSLANARFTLNTKDEFYSAEKDYYDEKMPVVQVGYLKYADAILRSKFLDELKTKINPVIIKQFELQKKAVSDAIVPEMQKDNALVTEYSKSCRNVRITSAARILRLSNFANSHRTVTAQPEKKRTSHLERRWKNTAIFWTTSLTEWSKTATLWQRKWDTRTTSSWATTTWAGFAMTKKW